MVRQEHATVDRVNFSDGSDVSEVQDSAAATVAWVDALETGVTFNLLRAYEQCLLESFRGEHRDSFR